VPTRAREPIQTFERPRRRPPLRQSLRVIGRRFLPRVTIIIRRITCSFQI
jgi:hypothetical protein